MKRVDQHRISAKLYAGERFIMPRYLQLSALVNSQSRSRAFHASFSSPP